MAKSYTLYLKGFVGSYDFDPDLVDIRLERKKGTPVSVLVNSTGGGVFPAMSILDAFRRHGDVSVHYVGCNASAATIVSMGAKHVSIDRHAMYMVHRASTSVWEWGDMNEENIRRTIEKLDKTRRDLLKFDGMIASLYAAKCKKTKDELLDLMKEGGWLTAQEALEWGFVDEVTDDKENAVPIDAETVEFFNHAGTPLPDNIIRSCGQDTLLDKTLESIRQVVNSLPRLFSNSSKNMISPKNICEFLNISELNDSLNREQVEMVETKIAELRDSIGNKDSEIDALKGKITALEAEIAKIKNAPAAKSPQILDPEGKKNEEPQTDMDKFINSVKKAHELFDSLP